MVAVPFQVPFLRNVVPVRNDQQVTLHGITWDQYVMISHAIPEGGGVHLTYLEGTLEIMTTGSVHEFLKKTLARLIEAYADEMGIDLNGYGNATFRKQAKERGLEPDESYVLGRKLGEGEAPDLAVEIVMFHGSIDKLAVYSGLGVPEVWFWEEGRLDVYCLGPSGYEARTRSSLLPDLDVAEMGGFVATGSQAQAVRAYRERVRERSTSSR